MKPHKGGGAAGVRGSADDARAGAPAGAPGHQAAQRAAGAAGRSFRQRLRPRQVRMQSPVPRSASLTLPWDTTFAVRQFEG